MSFPTSLARSLAIFQLGESGGGTIVGQARCSNIAEIDGDYADAMAQFVKEEHRHADILATCVHLLGGKLIEEKWTAKLFVRARRLIGLRLKVIVPPFATCHWTFEPSGCAGWPTVGSPRNWW